ncbi:MAG: hypothetical protein J0H94_04410 [Rhizobiales bacterium]|nr:hypothetical protein [Hyphomicrobiales bacterium]
MPDFATAFGQPGAYVGFDPSMSAYLGANLGGSFPQPAYVGGTPPAPQSAGGFLNGINRAMQANPELWSSIASALMAGPSTKGAIANMGQVMPGAMKSDARRRSMNEVLKNYPNMDQASRSYFMANPEAFDSYMATKLTKTRDIRNDPNGIPRYTDSGDEVFPGVKPLDGPAGIFAGKSVQAQGLNYLINKGAITEEQAAQLAASKTVTGADGTIYLATPSGIFANGQPVTGAEDGSAPDDGTGGGQPGMIPMSGAKTYGSEDQTKSAGFAKRMIAADQVIGTKASSDAGTNWWQHARAEAPAGLGNYLVSDDYQKLDQAQRDFVNGIRECAEAVFPAAGRQRRRAGAKGRQPQGRDRRHQSLGRPFEPGLYRRRKPERRRLHGQAGEVVPTFEITTPDGKVFHVEGPNAEGALDAVKKMQAAQPSQPAASDPPSSEPANPMEGQGSMFDTAMNGATFGLGDEAAGVIGGLMGLIDGKGFDYGYNKVTGNIRDSIKDYRTREPTKAALSEIGGALATVPVTGAINLFRAPALAAKTAPLLTRAAASVGRGAATLGNAAATGATYGAIYGAGDAEGGIPERFKGAVSGGLMGGALGAAAPVVGAGIRGASWLLGDTLGHPIQVARRFMMPDKAAANAVVKAVSRDVGGAAPVKTATDILDNARAAGTPMTALDLGETTRALGRAASNGSPEGRATLNQMLDDRFEGQAGRVIDGITSMVPGVNAPATREALQQAAQRANDPAYRLAYRQGEGGVWHEGLQQLTYAPAVQRAIQKAEATGANRAAVQGVRPPRNPFVRQSDGTLGLKPGVRPTLQFWDHVQRNLGDEIDALKRAGRKSAAGDATALKQQLNGYLDQAVPSFRQARAGAASFFGAENALDAGAAFVRRAGDNAGARRAIASMSKPERQLFAEGFATQLVDDLRNIPDRRSVVGKIFESPAARQRFELALGPQAAKEMEVLLRSEVVMDMGRKALQGNSSTVRQLIETGLVSGAAGMTAGGGDLSNPTTWITAALTGFALRKGRGLVSHVDANIARRVAEMLASQDPQVVKKALRVIGNNPRLFNGLRRGYDVMSRALVPVAPRPQVSPVMVGATPGGTEPAQAQQ